MLSRAYLIYGILALVGYLLSSYEGWELLGARQALPGAGGSSYVGRSPGGQSSSHSSPWGLGGGK